MSAQKEGRKGITASLSSWFQSMSPWPFKSPEKPSRQKGNTCSDDVLIASKSAATSSSRVNHDEDTAVSNEEREVEEPVSATSCPTRSDDITPTTTAIGHIYFILSGTDSMQGKRSEIHLVNRLAEEFVMVPCFLTKACFVPTPGQKPKLSEAVVRNLVLQRIGSALTKASRSPTTVHPKKKDSPVIGTPMLDLGKATQYSFVVYCADSLSIVVAERHIEWFRDAVLRREHCVPLEQEVPSFRSPSSERVCTLRPSGMLRLEYLPSPMLSPRRNANRIVDASMLPPAMLSLDDSYGVGNERGIHQDPRTASPHSSEDFWGELQRSGVGSPSDLGSPFRSSDIYSPIQGCVAATVQLQADFSALLESYELIRVALQKQLAHDQCEQVTGTYCINFGTPVSDGPSSLGSFSSVPGTDHKEEAAAYEDSNNDGDDQLMNQEISCVSSRYIPTLPDSALKYLLVVIENLLYHGAEIEKYRVLVVGTRKFQHAIGRFEGAVLTLFNIGFIPALLVDSGKGDEKTMHLLSDASGRKYCPWAFADAIIATHIAESGTNHEIKKCNRRRCLCSGGALHRENRRLLLPADQVALCVPECRRTALAIRRSLRRRGVI